MNKYIYILLAVTLCLITACGSDDEPTQDYTSFVVTTESTNTFTDCIAAYKDLNGNFRKIAEFESITNGEYSKEIILNEYIKEIYLFARFSGIIRFDNIYSLDKNKKNVVIIKKGTKGIEVTDVFDPTQYPT